MKKVTSKTKALIVVMHYAGIPVDINGIFEHTKHPIQVIEDCTHAICSSSINPNTGDYVGKAGCLATISFHETKNVCIGERGLLVIKVKELWCRTQVRKAPNALISEQKWRHFTPRLLLAYSTSCPKLMLPFCILIGALKCIDCTQYSRLQIWDTYDNENTLPWQCF